MNTARTIAQQPAACTELVPIVEKDVAEVAAFIADQSRRSREATESHLRWFLLENPTRQPQDPLGYALRADGCLAGCILCSPQAFRFENRRIVFMGSSSFYVDDHHRGHGGRIFLQYLRLGKQWPLFGTSANAEAAALWKAAGASPIAGSEAELWGVLHWPPVAEEFAHRRTPNPLLSRLARSSASNIVGGFRRLKFDFAEPDALRKLTSAEQVSDLLTDGLVIHDSPTKITAARDLPYVRWRYFSARDSTVAVFAFRDHRLDRDALVTVNQRTRGYRGQIKTLNVLDVYPDVSAESRSCIVGALIALYRKSVDAIVLRSLGPELREFFCERGFRARSFDAPTGWFIDKAKLLPAADWYAVPADGDGLI
jgi:hypothetical protein